MFFTDITRPDSHPFVRKCWDMTLRELAAYAKVCGRRMNAYAEANMDADAELYEERTNIAWEVYDYRIELQDRLGSVAPTEGQL